MLLTATRLAAFATALTMLIPAASAGDECQADTDCPEGQVCNFYNTLDCPDMPPCAGDDCPDAPACDEAVTDGECGFADGSECAADSDCAEGFTCEIVGGWASAGSACLCPDDGSECECPEDDAEASSGDIYGCVPAPCESDSDCGDEQVCVVIKADCDSPPPVMGGPEPTEPDCEGDDCGDKAEPGGSSGSSGSSGSGSSGSDSGSDGDDGDDWECDEDEVVAAYCAPKWAAPCETASDCGEGFTCEAVEVCECSGGGSTGSAGSSSGSATPGGAPAPADGTDSGDSSDGGTDDEEAGSSDEGDGEEDGSDSAPPAPGDREDEDFEDGCECYEGDENQCVIIEVECSTDDDCPASWECLSGPSMSMPCTFDSESGEEDCPEPETAPSTCQPEGYFGGGYDFDSAADSEAGGTGQATSGPGADPQAGDGEDGSPTAPNDDGSGAGGGDTTGDSDSNSDSNTDGGGNAADGTDSGGGCAGGSAPSTGLLALLALGLTVVLRRRQGLRPTA